MMAELSASLLSAAIKVNGQQRPVETPLNETLLTTLRDTLQLTAAKRGCNQGVCGACTVQIDGVPMRACLSLTQGCVHREVHTLEGLNHDPLMQSLQASFAKSGAFQCGFCTSGVLLAAHALLRQHPRPTEPQVRSALSGNLCRCTGYVPIIEAVMKASARTQGASA
jgi:carbon-monoxide dehydrogenase small subunit